MRAHEQQGSRVKAGAASRRGMTMLELLLVMTIIAVVLGAGVGAFASLDLGKRAAVGLVQNAARSARNWAVARQAPSRLRIDPATGTLWGEGEAIIGTWHFEALPVKGAFRLDGQLEGGFLIDDGYQGKALSFAGAPSGSRAVVAVHQDPAYQVADGFAVECAVRLEESGSASLLSIGQVVRLECTRQGAVRAWFRSQGLDEATRQPVVGGKIIVETPAGTLRHGRWTNIAVRYDRRFLTVWVDGVRADAVPETAPVWKVDGPLVLSGGTRAFPGSIDSLVISAVTRGEEIELPDTVSFSKDTPTIVQFDPGGRLDRTLHAKPIELVMDFLEGPSERITISLYGTVEQ